MLFASAEYLLVFLPATVIVYFWLARRRLLQVAKSWLILTSLFFYGWWNPSHLPLILVSIGTNFAIGARLAISAHTGSSNLRQRQWLLAIGVAFNLTLLGFYKYAGFAIENLSSLVGLVQPFESPALPLAISFFTFTQIAYLADSYRGEVKDYKFANYILFVTFFPHLIAGPIVHHKEIMPQFAVRENWVLRHRNLAIGLFLIAIGLAKKVLIADIFAQWATAGFDHAATLNFLEAWLTSLSYTFQLYFDFSGYTDMALGAALLFNIRMPINFNSPYRACSIQDFWRRWHITLGRFLRGYVYVPLGGKSNKQYRTHVNLMATFVIGGIWHGAGWMFVIWGALHGLAMILHRCWTNANLQMPLWLGWFLTFNFVNASWVFFRAKDIETAQKVLGGMINLASIETLFAERKNLAELLPFVSNALTQAFLSPQYMLALFILAFVIVLHPHNSTGWWLAKSAWRNATPLRATGYGIVGAAALMGMLASPYAEFIYFNF